MSTQLKSARTKSFADTAQDEVRVRVEGIVADIRARGDVAVAEYADTFDHWTPESFRLSPEQVEAIIATLPQQVLDDIVFVQSQVRNFAEVQRACLTDVEVETLPGVFLGHRHVPVQAAGAYIPGGKYPLTASAHMTIVTAKVAGVPRVVACTPPIRGEIPAATVAAMSLAGADEIWILGGVQAVAAMAIGTETMQRVDLIAGPGNAYVAEAKRQLFGEVGIDLFAGPTEILIVADDDADPFLVAVDLLSQAEHGPESPAILVTTSQRVAREAMAHVERILPGMPTADYAGPAWRDFGQVIVADDLDEAYAVADSFAAEHVQIFTADPRLALAKMHHYGALFLGENTCVSYGDKVIGTNHVLPTLGAARYTGGLWVGKYLRTVTYQEVRNPDTSGELGRVCGRASRVELFEGHARSGDARAARHLGDRFDWIDTALDLDPRRPPVTDLSGRTALVTGGGNGLGAAIARALHGQGADVVVVGRRTEPLAALCTELGPRSSWRPCDVADPDAVDALAAALTDVEISIVINNAGVAGPVAPLTEIGVDEWDQVFDVNVRGVFLLCKAFLPAMVRRGAGDVINLASVSGKRPLIRRTPYAASKMAVIGLTSTLAFEVGPAGVNVNTLSPGPVAGPRMERNFTLEAARSGTSYAAAEHAFVSRAALGRMVTEDEVGAAVLAMLAMPGLCGADIDLSAGMVA